MKHLFTSIACSVALLMGSLFSGVRAQTGGTDVVVNPVAGQANRFSRVSVAFDGSIYVGRLFSTVPGAHYSHWEILKSTDKGATFTPFADNLLLTGYYTAFDMVAAGTDAGNFRLFMALGVNDTIGGTSRLLFNSYDISGMAQSIELGATEFTTFTDGRGYASLSLCTDSRDKINASNPYAVSLVAAKAGIPNDSVLAWVSNYAFATHYRRGIRGSSAFIRTVSASLGSTSSDLTDYGRLGIAWDEFGSPSAPWGTIYLQYVYGDDGGGVANGGPYATPAGFRSPSIALSQNSASVADIRTVLLTETGYATNNVGIYANVITGIIAAAPVFDGSLVEEADSGRQIHPHVAYDVIGDTYLMSYYDSATHALVYKQKTLGSPAGEAPVTIGSNYRAATGKMAAPYPRVDMGNTDNKAVFVWNDGDSTLFDAEISYVSIQENTLNLQNPALYPNPAQEHITLTFSSNANDNLSLRVVDMTGKTLYTANAQAVTGNNQLPLALPNLAAGQYLLLVQGRQTNGTVSFLINR